MQRKTSVFKPKNICPGCPVADVLSQMSCRRCPVADVLSQMSCRRCPVADVLLQMSCRRCPVADVLSQMFCPGCLITTVLPQLSCLGCPVAAVLSYHTLAILSSLSCHGFPFLTVLSSWLSRLFSPAYPVPAPVLSRLCCPVLWIRNYLFRIRERLRKSFGSGSEFGSGSLTVLLIELVLKR